MKATLAGVSAETESVKTFTFWLDGPLDYRPGYFIRIRGDAGILEEYSRKLYDRNELDLAGCEKSVGYYRDVKAGLKKGWQKYAITNPPTRSVDQATGRNILMLTIEKSNVFSRYLHEEARVGEGVRGQQCDREQVLL